MKKAIKQLLLVSIGINACLFAVALTLDAAQLALLAVCSAALCGYGYLGMEGGEE